MNLSIDKSDVKKIKISYRVFCFFICIILLICLVGTFVFGAKENLLAAIGMSLVFLLMLYVFLPIAITGYPPKMLMWTLDKR